MDKNTIDNIVSGLKQVAVNVLKEASQLAMLLCVKCLNNNERDNFIQCRTIDKIKGLKKKRRRSTKKLQTMKKRITAIFDTRVDNDIKTGCEEVVRAMRRMLPSSREM